MKKNMRKVAALGLCVALGATMLTACGGSKGESASGGKTELNFGIWDENQRPAMEKMVKAYEKENSDVKINIQLTPYKGGEYWTKLEAAASGGKAPDVFWLNVLHLDSYVEGGILDDLTDKIKDSDIKDSYSETLVNNYVRDKKNYAVPKDFDTNAMWYNKEIFDKCGVPYPTDDMSYDDLIATAKALKDSGKLGDGVYPFACPVDFQTWYYQTVYAKNEGSAAAPTAGLHFTKELLQEIEEMGVKIAHVTLHVGLGTFRPVKVDTIEDHHMHSEFYIVEESEAKKINDTKANGGRVICVGTTSCRTLESATGDDGILKAGSGWTEIFIYPGYKFKILDCLITNFHLPESTLVMLVSALAGREHILNAYQEAIKERYRFFSFGDAMFIH